MRHFFGKSSNILGNDMTMFDQQSFYKAFEKDLLLAQDEVIIESPFITIRRTNELLPTLTRLRERGVSITVNTRNPVEHDAEYEAQLVALAQRELATLESRLSSLRVSFAVPDQLLADLIRPEYNPLFGARPVKRLIKTHFEMPLAEQIMNGRLSNPVTINGSEPWLELPT